MENEFVPYELSLELKKLGFDEPCFCFYFSDGEKFQQQVAFWPNNSYFNDSPSPLKEVTAPTYSQAFRFFRNKYKASPTITCQSELGNSWKYHIPNTGGEMDFETYEAAEKACLKGLIEMVKGGNK